MRSVAPKRLNAQQQGKQKHHQCKRWVMLDKSVAHIPVQTIGKTVMSSKQTISVKDGSCKLNAQVQQIFSRAYEVIVRAENRARRAKRVMTRNQNQVGKTAQQRENGKSIRVMRWKESSSQGQRNNRANESVTGKSNKANRDKANVKRAIGDRLVKLWKQRIWRNIRNKVTGHACPKSSRTKEQERRRLRMRREENNSDEKRTGDCRVESVRQHERAHEGVL